MSELRVPKYFKGLFDFALFMTVIPGAGGKPYAPDGLKNVRFAANGSEIFGNILRGVDGAVNDVRMPDMVSSGGQWFVVGSAFFGSEGKYKSFPEMQRACDALVSVAEQHSG